MRRELNILLALLLTGYIAAASATVSDATTHQLDTANAVIDDATSADQDVDDEHTSEDMDMSEDDSDSQDD